MPRCLLPVDRILLATLQNGRIIERSNLEEIDGYSRTALGKALAQALKLQ